MKKVITMMLLSGLLVALGVSSANAQFNFLDDMESLPGGDITLQPYTFVDLFRDANQTVNRTWLYNSASAPGKTFTSQVSDGLTNSAVFRTDEVLTSDTWMVSVEGTGSSNGAAEWIAGVIAAQDLALAGNGKLANG